MHRRNVCHDRWLLLTLCVLSLLGLNACGSSTKDVTPTLSNEEIFTAAVQTFTSQQATQLALIPPTDTPAPSPFPTLAPPPSPFPTISFATPTLAGALSSCDNSVFVNDVTVPDHTDFAPSAKFTKSWLLQNSGSCTWNTSYKWVFVKGDQMGGTEVFVPMEVPPGQQVKISVDLVAPGTDGSYQGYWRMQNANGQPFGDEPWVWINVGTAPTKTPKPATETATP